MEFRYNVLLNVMWYNNIYIKIGNTPWVAETEKEFIKVITTQPIIFPKKIIISINAKDFI